ncbi:MAG: magnesium transporter CorA family protein [Neisseriaceae bacterium]|nr:magnesium transporter CorA family protein [Neisseriaceae bacterium]
MLYIYDSQLGWQAAQSILPPAGWLKLINPSKEEMTRVAQHYQIPLELIQPSLDMAERPRIQSKEGAHLIVTHLPIQHDAEQRAPFGVMPLGMILKAKILLTVSRHESPILDASVNHYVPYANAVEQTHLVYRLLAVAVEHFLDALQAVEHKVTSIETELQKSIKNKQVFKLLNQNKSLIAFANSLQSNTHILNTLRRKSLLVGNDATHDLLLDVQVATEQAHAIAKTHGGNLRNLMDAYSAAIENNLSLVVQYLSIYVIIMAIPMGIAGIYGMNTPLPLQDEPYILPLLGLIGLIVAGLVTTAFKSRKII